MGAGQLTSLPKAAAFSARSTLARSGQTLTIWLMSAHFLIIQVNKACPGPFLKIVLNCGLGKGAEA